jgi:hypothetical protein
MPSRTAVGAAPLVVGLALAFQSAQAGLDGGLSPWSVAAFVGGCGAVIVGLRTLLGSNAVEEGATENGRAAPAALGLAAVAFAVGAAVAVV